MDISGGELTKMVGEFAAVGLVAWLVKRVFTHTIPRLAEDFKVALDRQLNAFSESLGAMRTEFTEELRAQRKEFFEEIRESRSECRSCRDKMDDLIRTVRP